MAGEVGQIGGVGSLVGASMETAGHYLQSGMLDVINNGLGNSLGMLLYAMAFFSAIFLVGVGGKYKYGLWFLYGPPLFWLMVTTRVPSAGAKWEFGSREYPEQAVRQVTLGTAEKLADVTEKNIQKPAMVSWFFAHWNKFTTGVIQTFVSVINLNKDNSDLDFVSKVERYQQALQLRVTDPKLKLFVNLMFINKCTDFITSVQRVYDPGLNDIQRTQAKQYLAKISNDPVVNLNQDVDLVNWLKGIEYNKGTAYDKIEEILITDQRRKIDRSSLTCKDMWTVAVKFFSVHAEQLIDSLAAANIPPGMTFEQVKMKLQDKFSTSIIEGGEVNSLDDQQKVLLLINEVTARLLFSEISRLKPNLVQVELDKTPELIENFQLLGTNLEFQVADEFSRNVPLRTIENLREYQSTEQWQGKGDYLTAALALPYLQGVVLFFLAAAFPFFALVLLVPGRQHAFFLWMGLWFWVKSWDAGYAITMLVDKILYGLLPHGTPVDTATLADPSRAFKSLLEIDPTYSVSTYYTLIATCMMAVPVLTAVFVKKGGAEVMSAVSQGFHNFAGKIGGAMAVHARSFMAQSKDARIHRNIRRRVDGALPEVLDTGVRAAFGTEIVANKLASYVDTKNGSKLEKIAGGFLQEFGARAHRVGIERLKYNYDRIIYDEGISPVNRRLGSEAVGQKFYTNDIVPEYPVPLDVLKANVYFPIGKVADRAVRGTVDSATGLAKKFISSGAN